MPLKLIPPRQGKTPNYSIRGTHLGVYVDETTKTPVEATAKKFLRRKRDEIECGELTKPIVGKEAEPTFATAAMAYLDSGRESQYLGRFNEEAGEWEGGLIPHFGDRPLSDIDQQAIDAAAITLYPLASAATRNRHVYTPVSAVLKHSGVDFKIKRPKGWRGNRRTSWLQPEQAFRLFEAARGVDPEFAGLLVFLCYTGARLADGLKLTCDRLILSEAFAYFETTKNDDPRGVHLPPFLVAEMANHPRGLDRGKEKVFRFTKCGRLYNLMRKTKTRAGADLSGATFHVLCHTWATWMRRYAGLDVTGLVSTGRWRDRASASRYEHVIVSEEARKADLLPTPQRNTKSISVEYPWKTA